jgi:hypothetical protein
MVTYHDLDYAYICYCCTPCLLVFTIQLPDSSVDVEDALEMDPRAARCSWNDWLALATSCTTSSTSMSALCHWIHEPQSLLC